MVYNHLIQFTSWIWFTILTSVPGFEDGVCDTDLSVDAEMECKDNYIDSYRDAAHASVWSIQLLFLFWMFVVVVVVENIGQ